MEEKKIIYQVIVDCWSLFKDHISEPLSEEEWEHIVKNANAKSEKYRDQGTLVWHFFRDVYTALEHYKQERDKKGA